MGHAAAAVGGVTYNVWTRHSGLERLALLAIAALLAWFGLAVAGIGSSGEEPASIPVAESAPVSATAASMDAPAEPPACSTLSPDLGGALSARCTTASSTLEIRRARARLEMDGVDLQVARARLGERSATVWLTATNLQDAPRRLNARGDQLRLTFNGHSLRSEDRPRLAPHRTRSIQFTFPLDARQAEQAGNELRADLGFVPADQARAKRPEQMGVFKLLIRG